MTTFLQTIASPYMVGICWFMLAFYFLSQPFKWAGAPLAKTKVVSEYLLDINITVNMFVTCGFYGSMYVSGFWK